MQQFNTESNSLLVCTPAFYLVSTEMSSETGHHEESLTPTASVLRQIRPLQLLSTLRICYSLIMLTVHQPYANLPTYQNGIKLYSALPSNI